MKRRRWPWILTAVLLLGLLGGAFFAYRLIRNTVNLPGGRTIDSVNRITVPPGLVIDVFASVLCGPPFTLIKRIDKRSTPRILSPNSPASRTVTPRISPQHLAAGQHITPPAAALLPQIMTFDT